MTREEAFDAIRWYVKCLHDLYERKPVRGLSEAIGGYEIAMRRLENESKTSATEQ